MMELMLLFAKALPEEKIIEELSDSLMEYKTTGTEESKKKLAMYCMMFTARVGTEKDDISTTIKKFDERSRALDVFENSKQ